MKQLKEKRACLTAGWLALSAGTGQLGRLICEHICMELEHEWFLASSSTDGTSWRSAWKDNINKFNNPVAVIYVLIFTLAAALSRGHDSKQTCTVCVSSTSWKQNSLLFLWVIPENRRYFNHKKCSELNFSVLGGGQRYIQGWLYVYCRPVVPNLFCIMDQFNVGLYFQTGVEGESEGPSPENFGY